MHRRTSAQRSIAFMKTFSIKELEILCDVKAHTIRVWEKRYGAFQPQRTAANARRYTTNDLNKLLDLVVLTKSGYKISSLSQQSSGEISQNLRNLVEHDGRILKVINELISCMYTLDVAGFDGVLDTSFLSWPVHTVITEIIYPFLQKVGLLCQGSRLNEEHFIVTAIRKKLYWSVQRTVTSKKQSKTILLFLSGERQLDLLLLYMYYCLEAAGWHVIHLGVDISVRNLEDFLRLQKIDYLLTYFAKKPALSVAELSVKMDVLSPQTKLLVLKGDKCFSAIETHNVLALKTDEVLAYLDSSETTPTEKKAFRLAEAL